MIGSEPAPADKEIRAVIGATRFIALAFLCFGAGLVPLRCAGQERSSESLARPAQCLIEVNGVHYLGGLCVFTPIDKQGSFRISTRKGLSAEVDVWNEYEGMASWSGPKGGKANAIQIGKVYSKKLGGWSGEENDDYIGAWRMGVRVYVGSFTYVGDQHSLAWGEREGMGARIIARSGLDTENASISAEKDRGGAIYWCRGNGDYSLRCIDQTLNAGPAPRKTTIHADCRTKIFTDYWGVKREYLGKERIFDIATNQEIPMSPAANWGISLSAIEALCPKTYEKATPSH